MLDVKSPVPSKDPVEPKRKCSGCARLPVCQVFRVYSEYVAKEWTEKKLEPPFPPEKLAELCKYFLPQTAVRLSTPMSKAEEPYTDGPY